MDEIAVWSRIAFPLRSLLHTMQLMPPELFESDRPFVEWPDCLGVGPIQHPAAVASDVNQSNISQDTQVLRDRRLFKAQPRHNVPDRTLLQGQIVQDFPPPGFGDGIERI
jgi:hypothetical protein